MSVNHSDTQGWGIPLISSDLFSFSSSSSLVLPSTAVLHNRAPDLPGDSANRPNLPFHAPAVFQRFPLVGCHHALACNSNPYFPDLGSILRSGNSLRTFLETHWQKTLSPVLNHSVLSGFRGL